MVRSANWLNYVINPYIYSADRYLSGTYSLPRGGSVVMVMEESQLLSSWSPHWDPSLLILPWNLRFSLGLLQMRTLAKVWNFNFKELKTEVRKCVHLSTSINVQVCVSLCFWVKWDLPISQMQNADTQLTTASPASISLFDRRERIKITHLRWCYMDGSKHLRTGDWSSR